MDTDAQTIKSPSSDALSDIFSEVQRIGQDAVRDHAAEVDADGRWPENGLRALQAAGLGGLLVPREYGGLGHGMFALGRACEILAQECASTAICYGMHCVGSSVIAAQPTTRQIDEYLRPIAEGRHFTTLALSEPGTGAHFYYPQTRLRFLGNGGLGIDGTKCFVTNGGHADSYVVSVMHDDPGELAKFSCVVLDATLENLSWGEPWRGFGMRGNESRTLTLSGVRASDQSLLGREGDQIWYVFHVVAPAFLIAMSGTYLGVAGAALELGIGHLKTRDYRHDGRRLADETVLQHRIGELWGRVEAARQLVYSAARRFDAGDADALAAILTCKAEVAEVSTQTVNDVMSLMGGIAYRDGARIQRLLRDVRAAHVMAPTTDLLRTWAGRVLLGHPILGE